MKKVFNKKIFIEKFFDKILILITFLFFNFVLYLQISRTYL